MITFSFDSIFFVSSLFLLLNPFSKYPLWLIHHHKTKKNDKKFGNFYIYRVNLTNLWKKSQKFPKIWYHKIEEQNHGHKLKSRIAKLNSGFFPWSWDNGINLKIMNFDYFSNQNKYIFCKEQQKFMLNFMDLSSQDC
jgi:hypothetical protein